MQDALRSSFESSIIPAFEQSCKTMFEQVDGAFQKGMSEHGTAIQQQVAAAHSPLAQTLRVGLQAFHFVLITCSARSHKYEDTSWIYYTVFPIC